MDILDIFLKKYSYKFPKGYPDMNNEQDILLMESILNELGMDLNEVFRNLSYAELSKRGGGRFNIIAKKISKNLPFNLTNNKSVTLQFINPEYQEIFEKPDLEKIKQLSPKSINSFKFFKDENGKEYSFSDLLKDQDFGGKEKGSTTSIETAVMSNLNSKLEQNGPIDIKIKDVIYKNIVSTKNTPGMPKSDFELVDENGKSVIFISHKDGSTAKDFQQYGGVSDFKSESEVQDFLEAVKKEIGGDEMIRGGGYKRKVKNTDIILKSIYGINYGSSEYGINNIQIVCQGEINLVKIEDNIFALKSNHDLLNGTVPTEGYTPYFMVTFRSDRNDLGIKNSRFGIYPEATRPSAKEI
jgi:hypothetical protein